MLAILSPAKSLDYATAAPTDLHSVPAFLPQSQQLIDRLRQYAPPDLAALMRISSTLADLNYQRYSDWHLPFDAGNAKQALFAFDGDVYHGLEAHRFSRRDLNRAQQRLRILSGLYGLLRPLDLIQPYRLEMGTRLPTGHAKDLYGFWGDRITGELNRALAALPARQRVLVNLASNEYFHAVDRDAVEAPVITPTFRELQRGEYRFVSFFAKRARGLMAGYIIRNRVTTRRALQAFDWQGYHYSEAQSTKHDWVFLRERNPDES